ncbi:hypothetical protein RB614_26880 [Phytohabitans sp. ZYX-F-186]|uniref:Uncharacterized protein n=1 Tax=Phytohabitans maris TaxID=3071409 RepID=A0ABU0ZMD5_9ACTN|nr:hypothetical protein [Phytohabitans sp. ZYX-F-186]MDQ7908155.1 hypothetical protein [Phytohabitans sp. ZYX-F-186]
MLHRPAASCRTASAAALAVAGRAAASEALNEFGRCGGFGRRPPDGGD